MDWLPRKRLAKTPKIANREHISLALTELAAINTKRSALKSDLDAKTELAKQEFDAALVLPDGTRFADREAALSTAVETFAAAHRDDLLDGKTKTAKFLGGQISWKQARESVGFADGETEKSVLKKLEERGVTKALLAALQALSWFGAHLGLLLSVSVKLNKTGILQAHKKQELTDKQLENAGLQIVGGEEAITIKLDDYEAAKAA